MLKYVLDQRLALHHLDTFTPFAVNKHKLTHLKTKPFPCKLCHKAFTLKPALDAHMTTHTKQGKHKCELCGKVYTAGASLKRHRFVSIFAGNVE